MMKHHQLEPLFLISGFVTIVTKIIRLKVIVRRMIMAIIAARNIFLKNKLDLKLKYLFEHLNQEFNIVKEVNLTQPWWLGGRGVD